MFVGSELRSGCSFNRGSDHRLARSATRSSEAANDIASARGRPRPHSPCQHLLRRDYQFAAGEKLQVRAKRMRRACPCENESCEIDDGTRDQSRPVMPGFVFKMTSTGSLSTSLYSRLALVNNLRHWPEAGYPAHVFHRAPGHGFKSHHRLLDKSFAEQCPAAQGRYFPPSASFCPTRRSSGMISESPLSS